MQYYYCIPRPDFLSVEKQNPAFVKAGGEERKSELIAIIYIITLAFHI